MTMMFKIPSKQDGCDDDDVPLVAILKINEILKLLTNKLSCQVGPWNTSNLAYTYPKEEELLSILPEDIDFMELYVFGYNIFFIAGKIGYVRLNTFYSESTSIPDIQLVVIQL